MKKRAVSRVTALALALGMVFALNTSAFALKGLPGGISTLALDADGVTHVPPYQIDIYPGTYTSTPTGTQSENTALKTRFSAYQIFSGVVNTSSTPAVYPNPITGKFESIAPGELGQVQWGKSVPAAKYHDLLVALMNSGTLLSKLGITTPANVDAVYAGSTKLGQLFQKALAAAGYEIVTGAGDTVTNIYGSDEEGDNTATANDATLKNAAYVVGKVLSDFTLEVGTNKTALAEAFAKVVAAKNSSGYLYLGTAEATSTWNTDHWEIGDGSEAGADEPLAGGYYLVADEYGNGTGATDKSFSDFLVGVFGDIKVYAKADAPEITKAIVEHDNTDKRGNDFEAGETITFRLTGDLPANFANFDEYYYAFHDTMGTGLTYVTGSAKFFVTAKDSTGATVTVDITNIGNGVSITPNASHTTPAATHTLDAVINDVTVDAFTTAVTGAYRTQYGKTTETVTIDSSSTFAVVYSAYLNQGATLNALTGNTNQFYLEYSSNPNSSTTSRAMGAAVPTEITTPQQVYAYDFGLQVHKYDGSDPSQDPLAGAGFAVTKSVTGPLYVLVGPNGEQVYVTENDLTEYGITVAVDLATPTPDGGSGTLTETLGKIALEDAGLGKPYSDYSLLLSQANDDYELVTMSGTYYAVLTQKAAGSGSTAASYSLAGWVSEDELIELLDTHAHTDEEENQDTEADGTISTDEWVAVKTGITGDRFAGYTFLGNGFSAVASSTYYIAVTTPDSGDLRIEGLEGETYTLNEVYTKAGFDLIDPITVQYTATYYGANEGKPVGTLKSLTVKVTDTVNPLGKDYKIVEDGAYVDADDDLTPDYNELVVEFGVANYPSMWAPGTGGIGTTPFYFAGGVLLLGAAVLLVLTNRKKTGKRAQ